MREMFLENGFSDFIAKPIEIVKLNEVIRRWIPKSKQQKSAAGDSAGSSAGDSAGSSAGNSAGSFAGSSAGTAGRPSQAAIQIPGIDTERGLAMTGGTEAGYRKVLVSFYRDAQERFPFLEKVPGEEDLPLFTIQVHALKSAAATVGAAVVSKKAADLEAAGKAGDLNRIRENLPDFYSHLSQLIQHTKQELQAHENEEPDGENTGKDPASCIPALKEIKAALERRDIETVDRIIAELEKEPLTSKMKDGLNAISDQVLMTEFEAALKTANELLELF
jgi:HPt (histidine-containing phosphotransfer) domain-containing protein